MFNEIKKLKKIFHTISSMSKCGLFGCFVETIWKQHNYYMIIRNKIKNQKD